MMQVEVASHMGGVEFRFSFRFLFFTSGTVAAQKQGFGGNFEIHLDSGKIQIFTSLSNATS